MPGRSRSAPAGSSQPFTLDVVTVGRALEGRREM